MTTAIKTLIGFFIFISLLAAASSIYNWYAVRFMWPVSQSEYIKTPEIKKARKIKRVKIKAPEYIETLQKEEVVEKLKLPNFVAENADEQVIATAEIQPYEGKTNAVALLNTRTGAGSIIAKQVPLSFFAFENKKEVGFRAGYATDLAPRATVFGRWQFLRVGNVHLGFYGEGNTHSEAVGQIELTYRF